MALRKSKKDKDIQIGFTHKLEDNLLSLVFGKMNPASGMEAVKVYSDSLKKPSMKKSLFIIRKEAKPMGSAARLMMEEIGKCDDAHIKACAMVFSSISVMHLAKMMTPEDETDTQFFTDKNKATLWLSTWESKEQTKE